MTRAVQTPCGGGGGGGSGRTPPAGVKAQRSGTPARVLAVGLACLPVGLWACPPLPEVETFAETGLAPEGAACATYLAQSGPGVSCHWAFAYRDLAAPALADTLWQTLTTCRDGRATGEDLPVNHPDSYALREWVSGGATYHVTVKDKGAENRTLVFLRVEG